MSRVVEASADSTIKSKGKNEMIGETGSLRFMDFLIAWLNGTHLCSIC